MGNPKLVGSLIGLAVGVVVVWQGPLDGFITGLFIIGGWLIGKYLSGEVPIVDILLERFVSSRNKGSRR